MNQKQEEDYYFNAAGLLVFTEAYHLKRGSCCGNACKHCPYQHVAVKKNQLMNVWKKK